MNKKTFSFVLFTILLFASFITACGKKEEERWAWDAETLKESENLPDELLKRYLSDDGYLDPAAYGAEGDGVTDDSEAIQKAVNSGYNVRFRDDATYFIAEDRYIRIRGKKAFHMEGGAIHKAASPQNYNLFVIEDCEDCSFGNMYIYSEFRYKDILVPADHMRPEETKSSNVLAFSGYGNSRIRFYNNSFDYMNTDYWLNAQSGQEWRDVVVDGWKSSNTTMPMFTRCVVGLTVRNAVVKNHDACGDGDHCLYICYGTKDILVEDCEFTGPATPPWENTCVVLTFHGGDIENDTQPRNILIRNTTVNALANRALYAGEGVSIRIENSLLTKKSETEDNNVLIFGDGYYSMENCRLTGSDMLFNGIRELTLNNCFLSGAAENALISSVNKAELTNCQLEVGNGLLTYIGRDSNVEHLYRNCTIQKLVKTENDWKYMPYIILKSTTEGSVIFENCLLNCSANEVAADGDGYTTEGILFRDTEFCHSPDIQRSPA